MRPEDLDAAIHEFTGWKILGDNGDYASFPNDLNAMRMAEERIRNTHQWRTYMQKLYQIVGNCDGMTHCSALDKATAFCKTMWPYKFKS